MASVGTLYHSYGPRSSRVYWLALELGVKLDLKLIELSKGEHKRPEFAAINPACKIPVFMDENVGTLTESTAICLYLLDKYDEGHKLGGAPGSKKRALVYQYSAMVTGSLDDVVIPVLLNKYVYPEAYRSAAVVQDGTKKYETELGPILETYVKGKQYLIGDEFSAADVIVGYSAAVASRAGLLASFPATAEFAQRVMARPFYLTATTAPK